MEQNRQGGIPVLETERLVLRPHGQEDFAACVAMWADPAVVWYIGGKPSTEPQTWTRMLGYAGHWAWMGFGYWAVEEKAGARFIGELGFADFKRDVDPALRGVPELGWALATHAHGKGYATEALRAAVAWGDERFAGAKTFCLIAPENLASIRVAQKCGYAQYKRATHNGAATILFVRQAAEKKGGVPAGQSLS